MTADTAALSRSFEPGHRPITDQRSLELGQAAEQMELAAGRVRADGFGEAVEPLHPRGRAVRR